MSGDNDLHPSRPEDDDRYLRRHLLWLPRRVRRGIDARRAPRRRWWRRSAGAGFLLAALVLSPIPVVAEVLLVPAALLLADDWPWLRRGVVAALRWIDIWRTRK